MTQTLHKPRRRHRPVRRLLVAPGVGLVAVAAMLLAPAFASADSASTLTVLGTSDVQDSGLIPNLIAPQFKAAFPQFTFKYVPSATGTAIQNAESGTGGPSALIVHAPSLENQFVAGGFSYNNQYGNAIFTNDFVLAGPTGDPAGVGSNAANNIAQAFADVAAAGVAGKATFISRGGTNTASGTTVEEHAVWQLMNASGLTPSGVALCIVSAADGGGESPINAANPAAGGACPDSGTVNATDAPSWYFVNSGANQGANVVATNACTVGTSGVNTCYSLTDRGSFDYLSSGNSPAAGTAAIPNLAIVTRDNSASAPGGANELVNYFHVYIINPAAPGETVNLPAAQDLVNLLTSPALQSQLKTYLNNTTDPGGPPFVATASPIIAAAGIPSSVNAGTGVTATGTVNNAQPGFAPVANQKVSVNYVAGVLDFPVASGTTNATGGYSITFTPPLSGSYQVTTGQISLIENSALNPAYGDILSPGASSATALTVSGAAAITKTTTSTGAVQASGTVGPAGPFDGSAKVTLLARRKTSNGAFSVIGGTSVSAGQTAFAVNGTLAGGDWTVEVEYADPGSLNAATSATKNVTVPAQSTNVSFKKLTVKKGALTVSGTLGSAPTVSGAKVRLFALSLGKVSVTKPKAKTARFAAAAAAPTFRQVAKATVKKGSKTYTIKHPFKRGFRYALQLEYVNKGQTSTYSGYRYLSVH